MGRHKGSHLSETHKRAIANAKAGIPNIVLRGIHQTETHKRKLSEAQLGRKLTENHKRNILQAMNRRSVKNKLSNARTELWANPKSIYNTPTYRNKLAKIMEGNKRAKK